MHVSVFFLGLNIMLNSIIAYPYFILEWNVMLNSRIVIMGDYI
jgi:hypothetical protein